MLSSPSPGTCVVMVDVESSANTAPDEHGASINHQHLARTVEGRGCGVITGQDSPVCARAVSVKKSNTSRSVPESLRSPGLPLSAQAKGGDYSGDPGVSFFCSALPVFAILLKRNHTVPWFVSQWTAAHAVCVCRRCGVIMVCRLDTQRAVDAVRS